MLVEPTVPLVGEIAMPSRMANGLPDELEAAMVTVAGLAEVPPITRALWMMWLAVNPAPAATEVVPLPSMLPTC